MIKGLVGGLRTLCLAFALLFSVLYVIAVFATIAIGRGLTRQAVPGWGRHGCDSVTFSHADIGRPGNSE